MRYIHSSIVSRATCRVSGDNPRVTFVTEPGGRTPIRTVRVPDDLWRGVQVKTRLRGETVSGVIVRCLERYLRDEETYPSNAPD